MSWPPSDQGTTHQGKYIKCTCSLRASAVCDFVRKSSQFSHVQQLLEGVPKQRHLVLNKMFFSAT
eukprot:190904-Amphidinium_carterae.1